MMKLRCSLNGRDLRELPEGILALDGWSDAMLYSVFKTVVFKTDVFIIKFYCLQVSRADRAGTLRDAVRGLPMADV